MYQRLLDSSSFTGTHRAKHSRFAQDGRYANSRYARKETAAQCAGGGDGGTPKQTWNSVVDPFGLDGERSPLSRHLSAKQALQRSSTR